MGSRKKTKSTKLEVGAVYQKEPGGTYFFRYQVNMQRKTVNLKTDNQDKAIEKAKGMVPESGLLRVYHFGPFRRPPGPLGVAGVGPASWRVPF